MSHLDLIMEPSLREADSHLAGLFSLASASIAGDLNSKITTDFHLIFEESHLIFLILSLNF